MPSKTNVSDDPEFRRLLWYMLGGSRGGWNRARILHALRNQPTNMNQLAEKLGLEYRAVKHHVDILVKNSLVISRGEHYGMMYFLSPWLDAHFQMFEEICAKLNFEL
ncbi:MAG: winged helix-turn-helix domain-containing protein [Thaumarchaeota archaeon]|nr:winged helix-turn-helix domain-containing protein [Nitrososphaerota archaeon]